MCFSAARELFPPWLCCSAPVPALLDRLSRSASPSPCRPEALSAAAPAAGRKHVPVPQDIIDDASEKAKAALAESDDDDDDDDDAMAT